MHKVKRILYHLHPYRVTRSLRIVLRDESVGGKLVILAAILSLIVVNSPLQDAYTTFWHQNLMIGISSWTMKLSFLEWLNEGLMALFFLVVGLEIKREFTRGELRERKSAILPIGAAIGGVVVPAFLYIIFTTNTPVAHGWGIPISTDTAIALAVLALLKNHIPIQLKIFLLALAVADDVIAISVITLFYSEAINTFYLLCSAAIIALTFTYRSYLSKRLFLVVGLGILLWLTTHAGGVHASVVGVVMGLLAPIPEHGRKVSVPEKVERFVLPITTLFVVPLFAFANAGFIFTAAPLLENQYIIFAVMAGLIFGKVAGITIFSWILVKIGHAQLPDNVGWGHIIGVGFIAGIGFTVSIFIADLTFASGSPYIDSAKIGIFLGSIISALIGVAILRKIRAS
jgi:NhaA family Na+:H+ antiporter